MSFVVLLKLIFSSWKANFRLIIFSVLSVALGVALVFSVVNSNESILEQFNYSNKLIQGKLTAQLESIDGHIFTESELGDSFFESLLDYEFTPCLEVNLLDLHSGNVVKTIGVDLINDYKFRQYAFASDNPPITKLLNPQQGGLLVSQSLFKELKPQAQKLKLLFNNAELPFWVNDSVFLKNIGLVKAENGMLTLADIAYLRKVLNMPNKLSSIQFKDIEAEELRSKIKIPNGFILKSSSARRDEINKLTEAFRFNLQALSFIALLVATYLISQTIYISVQRKNKILGIVRVLGFSRKQVLILVLAESLLVGILGVLLGFVFGSVLSQQVLKALSTTVNELYFASKANELIWSAKGFWISGIVGLLSSLVATVPASVQALTVMPAINLRNNGFKNLRNLPAKFLVTVSSASLLAGITMFVLRHPLYRLPQSFNNNYFGRYLGFVLAFALLMVLCLFSQFVLRSLVSFCQRFKGWFTSLFVARFSGNFVRLWIATGALICGLSMTISINIMIDSFRHTVTDWINSTINGDIYISSKYQSTSLGLNPDFIEQIRQWPEVAELDYLSKHNTEYNGKPIIVGGNNLLLHLQSSKFINQLPNHSPQQIADLVKSSDNYVVVSNTFSSKHHLNSGDKLLLQTKLGQIQPIIAGVYQDYSSEHGYVLMKMQAYRKLFSNSEITNLAIYLKDKSQTEAIKNKISRLEFVADSKVDLRGDSQALINPAFLVIQSNADLKTTILQIFDQTFYISYLFFWIALLISVLTVSLTLLSCIEENKSLNATSYFLGASLKQIFVLEMAQGFLVTFTAIVLSIPGGWWLSEVLQQTVNNNSFGWIIYLKPNWLSIMLICSLALFGALIASFVQLRQIYVVKNISADSLASL